jgi:hypothetical protein
MALHPRLIVSPSLAHRPTSAPKATISIIKVNAGTVMVAHPEQMAPAALSLEGWGRSRDRLFGEERRQDTISDRGGNFHAGEVTARVGFNGPNKARLKCGPSDLPNRQVSQVTTM